MCVCACMFQPKYFQIENLYVNVFETKGFIKRISLYICMYI